MKRLIPGLLLILLTTAVIQAQNINSNTMNINLDEGGFSCLLSNSELAERKNKLLQEVFSKVKKVEEVDDGFLFHFDDDENLLSSLFYYIMAEKACCPFFQQDISIGADHSGITWKISGKNGVKEMLKEMFETIEFPKD